MEEGNDLLPTGITGEDNDSCSLFADRRLRCFFYVVAALCLATALFFLSHHNYLLFHGLVELSSISIALTLFSVGWNTRRFARNDSLLLLAIAYLSVSVIDLLHVLAYKGMGVFHGIGPNISTQLWIAARFLEAAAYLCAAVVLGRPRFFHAGSLLLLFGIVSSSLVATIWPLELFPACFVEGKGLTPFKVLSEYLICFILLTAFYILHLKQALFERRIFNLLVWSLWATIASELSFTLYSDVYGFTNFLGHYFKLISVIFLYRALIQGTLLTPYEGLFRDLKSSQSALEEELLLRQGVETELRASNQELDTFVRTVSHDLRTPLTPIIGYASYLKQRKTPPLDTESVEILSSIERQGKRMLSLMEDLLALSRVGHLEKAPEQVEADEILERISGEMRDRLVSAGVILEYGELPSIVTHHNFLYQIALNLVGNAIQYAGKEGNPIEVGGMREGESVRYYFRDHGKGIAEKDREKVFEPFCQKGGESSEGTGLGLAIVQKIARIHKGRAWVEETPGGGCTFWVEMRDLPSAAEENGYGSSNARN